jgi:hypothetical protein
MKRRSWSLNQIYEAYDCQGQKIFSAKSIFSCTSRDIAFSKAQT